MKIKRVHFWQIQGIYYLIKIFCDLFIKKIGFSKLTVVVVLRAFY